MRTLVHLSDIHFGRTNSAVVEHLLSAVRELTPDIVVISGDLTQRALPNEFEQARLFLEALPKPQIVVPGNHDIPLHNIYARFRRALDRYRRYISEDLEPFYQDREVAVIGINTARSLTVKGGRINETQMARIEERVCHLGNDVNKVVVTHHPFDLPEHYKANVLVGRAGKAMARFAHCGIDLLLAGHLHVSHSGPTAARYEANGYSAIFVQAGTACSTRSRGEPNSFNFILLERERMTVKTYASREGKPFQLASTQDFCRSPSGWVVAAEADSKTNSSLTGS